MIERFDSLVQFMSRAKAFKQAAAEIEIDEWYTNRIERAADGGLICSVIRAPKPE